MLFTPSENLIDISGENPHDGLDKYDTPHKFSLIILTSFSSVIATSIFLSL